MELTKDEVRDVALLARIGVTDVVVDSYQIDMSSIL
jgi:Asp-tRNA(Asn)/Glu-tRNA(Gln) amidotransferase C subunit